VPELPDIEAYRAALATRAVGEPLRGVRLRGGNRANDLRLRAFNITSGEDKGKCTVVAFVGNERIAEVTDDAAGVLQGRTSGFSLGTASGNAKGAKASFDDVVVRVPSPY